MASSTFPASAKPITSPSGMPVTPAKRAHPHRALKGQTPHTPLVLIGTPIGTPIVITMSETPITHVSIAETQYWDTPAAVEIKQSSAQAKPLQLPRSQNAHFQSRLRTPPHQQQVKGRSGIICGLWSTLPCPGEDDDESSCDLRLAKIGAHLSNQVRGTFEDPTSRTAVFMM
ncbi:hypothetical protein D6C76_02943 [Aureobasidium pullulans]|uniref:Uncharacterized protein n=1 Tax=Aureobasidium pullulans TaxID=5580 RepID=A0A4T0F141_AURPU|nr:hypothetical protein D6D22_06919 [Aureobasidium pullulans]TIA81090.1 hypothetical protein D6C76_02943 [Aureobasidium pullulans]